MKTSSTSFVFLLVLFFRAFTVNAQIRKETLMEKQWIIKNDRVVENDSLIFSNYAKEKLGLNTMIWTFLPMGKLDYDYQTADDMEACLGVDFLDLDVEACTWRFDEPNQKISLTLKGGYASIDDFVIKAEYEIGLAVDNLGQSTLILTKTRKIFFKDLTKIKK
jgi:hypothetical protein